MDTPDSRPLPATLFRQFWVRAVTFWWIKMIGMTLGMTGFFIAYFHVLHHPAFPITTMPHIAIDRFIAFRPEAMPLYLSLWLYVSLAPALLVVTREIITYGIAAVSLAIAGLAIFYFWPTAVPRLETSSSPIFDLLHSVDASGNACPSLHAAFTAFTAPWLAVLLRQMRAGILLHAVNWLWCVGILYSTIAVRQHVALDAIAGTALGAVIAAVALALLSNSKTNRA